MDPQLPVNTDAEADRPEWHKPVVTRIELTRTLGGSGLTSDGGNQASI